MPGKGIQLLKVSHVFIILIQVIFLWNFIYKSSRLWIVKVSFQMILKKVMYSQVMVLVDCAGGLYWQAMVLVDCDGGLYSQVMVLVDCAGGLYSQVVMVLDGLCWLPGMFVLLGKMLSLESEMIKFGCWPVNNCKGKSVSPGKDYLIVIKASDNILGYKRMTGNLKNVLIWTLGIIFIFEYLSWFLGWYWQ